MSGQDSKFELLEDEAVKAEVARIWGTVFKASLTVISHAELHGFEKMLDVPNPNIHEILLSLRMFNSIIDVLLSRAESFKAGVDEIRILMNSKQQLHCMEMIANALSVNDRLSYDHYYTQLSNQGCI